MPHRILLVLNREKSHVGVNPTLKSYWDLCDLEFLILHCASETISLSPAVLNYSSSQTTAVWGSTYFWILFSDPSSLTGCLSLKSSWNKTWSMSALPSRGAGSLQLPINKDFVSPVWRSAIYSPKRKALSSLDTSAKRPNRIEDTLGRAHHSPQPYFLKPRRSLKKPQCLMTHTAAGSLLSKGNTLRLPRYLQFGVTLKLLAHKTSKALHFNMMAILESERFVSNIPFLLVRQHCFSNGQLVCTVCPCYILRYSGDDIRCLWNCNRREENQQSDFSEHHQHCPPFAQPSCWWYPASFISTASSKGSWLWRCLNKSKQPPGVQKKNNRKADQIHRHVAQHYLLKCYGETC